jgi:hypothetical protein
MGPTPTPPRALPVGRGGAGDGGRVPTSDEMLTLPLRMAGGCHCAGMAATTYVSGM